MKVILLLLAVIPVFTGTFKEKVPQTVSLVLETSFLIQPKDLKDKRILINNIKNLTEKLFKTFGLQSIKHERRANVDARKYSFEDFMSFVKEAAGTVYNYSKIPEAKKALSKVKDTGKQFMKDLDEGKIIDGAKTGLDILKKELDKLTNFTRRMSNYYTVEDVRRMSRILTKLEKYEAKKKDLTKTYKEFLKIAVVDKYKSLNDTARVNLLNDVLAIMADMGYKDSNSTKDEGNIKDTGIESRSNLQGNIKPKNSTENLENVEVIVIKIPD